ncbi:TPA: methyltransferase domain-containing protein [Campylobacter lari]|uniref:class I SAM-dependent methyltransferase n=1 Tax=Campylobacter sp. IFREMER_LSEM_CL1890 TaxID=2911615 RepID=UPI0021E63BAA|nr:class I SAM-dependent methyltransferase [Campylobacter sp. IFREMER_LSEM_CL1890]MCV3409998.1 class I SAM-dependent methyltransferase [Campylobacter sp. IFREMER_LSEM_CL1890]HEC1798076.1 methyltransferase domain-containing protein [Campylobacter lari]
MNFIPIDQLRSIEDSKLLYKQRIDDAVQFYKKYGDKFVFRKCPICNSDSSTSIEPFIDLYSVAKCNVCNSIYVDLVPTNEQLADYYNHCYSNIIYANLNKTNKTQFKYKERVDFLYSQIIDYVNYHNLSDINILEIGCNNGYFLSLLKNKLNKLKIKKNLYGIDLDSNAIKEGMEREGGGDCDLKLFSMDASELGGLGVKFDFIVHYELIEHLVNPVQFMRIINENLQTNGVTIFTTPNILGLEAKAIGYNEERLQVHSVFPPMHLNSFSTQNILYFSIVNGFKLKSLDTPGNLDVAALVYKNDNLNIRELRFISKMSDKYKGKIQYLIKFLNASSYMRVVLEKNEN